MPQFSEMGSHFLVGLSGPALSPLDRKILASLKPAGILLFAYNFLHDAPYQEWLACFASLIAEVTKEIGREKFLISIDHEGGRVHRVPAPLTRFPYARTYANESSNVGRAMAAELKSIGVNFFLGPVVDVHSNPANPVIGDRAFGSSPEEVTVAALNFIESLHDQGILCCGKHFPGHGDTSTDSHLELPLVDKDLEALEHCEFLPFAGIIEAGVPAIMTAHILFPKVDPCRPATLSSTLLTSILRKSLRFKGVIVTDDLAMNAIASEFRKPETPALAIEAGCDLFCVSRFRQPDSDEPIELAVNLAMSAKRGEASPETLQASKNRLSALMCEVSMFVPSILPAGVLAEHGALRKRIEDTASD